MTDLNARYSLPAGAPTDGEPLFESLRTQLLVLFRLQASAGRARSAALQEDLHTRYAEIAAASPVLLADLVTAQPELLDTAWSHLLPDLAKRFCGNEHPLLVRAVKDNRGLVRALTASESRLANGLPVDVVLAGRLTNAGPQYQAHWQIALPMAIATSAHPIGNPATFSEALLTEVHGYLTRGGAKPTLATVLKLTEAPMATANAMRLLEWQAWDTVLANGVPAKTICEAFQNKNLWRDDNRQHRPLTELLPVQTQDFAERNGIALQQQQAPAAPEPGAVTAAPQFRPPKR